MLAKKNKTKLKIFVPLLFHEGKNMKFKCTFKYIFFIYVEKVFLDFK